MFRAPARHLSHDYWIVTERKSIIDLLPRGKGERILDAGCGVGIWLLLMGLKKSMSEIIGLDLSKGALRYARQFLQGARSTQWIIRANLMNCPFRDETFDQTLCLWVLIHIPDPNDRIKIIQELGRTLKAGGTLILAVTNELCPMYIILSRIRCLFSSIRLRNASIKGKKGIFKRGWWYNEQLYMYSFFPWEIKGFLKNEGFSIQSVRTVHFIPFELMPLFSWLHSKRVWRIFTKIDKLFSSSALKYLAQGIIIRAQKMKRTVK